MSQNLRALALGLAVLLLATACLTRRQPVGASGSVPVVTSIGILADFASQVGGPRVRVQAILPPGADPHTFEPTPRDAQTIRSAALVVLNGAGLEPRALETLVTNNRRAATPMLALADAVGASLIHADDADDEHGGVNPHCWLDPRLAQLYVEQLRDALSSVDPAGAGGYRANADRYLSELRELDRALADQIDTIPPAQRKLVTYHDAYVYMARRYGLEQVGFVLRNPGREPSAGELAALVATLRATGVRTVFAEPQLNARILETAAREAGVEVGVLYSDAFDDRVASYTALMRFNADQLVKGLR
jgi:manganese/iron transport system substrate-binding protein